MYNIIPSDQEKQLEFYRFKVILIVVYKADLAYPLPAFKRIETKITALIHHLIFMCCILKWVTKSIKNIYVDHTSSKGWYALFLTTFFILKEMKKVKSELFI